MVAVPTAASLVLRQLLPAAAATTTDELLQQLQQDRSRLPVLFPGLPRRCGREPIASGTGLQTVGSGRVDLAAFRSCDLVAGVLLLDLAASADELYDLYAHGDIEERTMVLRALHFLPIGPITVRLFGEVQRTNMLVHLEAALCDGDLLWRAESTPDLSRDATNKLLLKLAFLDLPLLRAPGAEQLANADLSRMLQDLATEREAAGRAVWRDTARMLGRAPVPGTVARLLGGLEHGDDGIRLAAAEGLLLLQRPEFAAFAAERLPREPRPAIRALLQQLAAGNTPQPQT